MLLDLYITHWTEPWEIGSKAFHILAVQRKIDWSNVRVTLVHDGVEAFPPEYFDMCPFPVRQVCLPHGGIAAARNWCIDDSIAEWIKWCDFDDCFAGLYSMYGLLDGLRQAQAYDMLWFNIYAEGMDERLFEKTDRDVVLVHGKAFRRQFLIDSGIRFNEDLTWCEDSAFLAEIEMDIDHHRIGKIKGDYPIYAWICRDGSLCNRPEIKFDNLKSFFRRHCYVQEQFLKRGHIEQYYVMSVRVLADAFYALEKSGIGSDEQREEHRKTVRQYYAEHRLDLLKVSKKRFDEVIAAVNFENDDCHITKEEFLAWLRTMREDKGE